MFSLSNYFFPGFQRKKRAYKLLLTNGYLYIPLNVRKGKQQHFQEVLSKIERHKNRGVLADVGGELKKEKGVTDLKTGVQGQTVFMSHPLFRGRILAAIEETVARWNTSHVKHTHTN